jgi:gamma-glutamylputrescine oxidase
MNLSYWEQESYFNKIDLAIIGSGIVGLSAAIHYKELYPSSKVVVLERGILPSGASSKNAGFACFGSPSEIIDDLSHQSEEETFALVEKRWRGLQVLRKRIGDEKLNYKNYGSYEIFKEHESFEQCLSQLPYLNRKLQDITGVKNVYSQADEKIKIFGFKNASHLIENKLEGQLNTGEMIKSLYQLAVSKGIIIINGIEVEKPMDSHKEVLLRTGNFSFSAKKVIVAVNGFAKQLFPELEVNPGRAQVLVTSPIENLKIKGTFHFDKGYYYFRNIGNRVLFGGGRNLNFKGEETYEMNLTEQIQQSLEHHLKSSILPDVDFTIDHRWSGIMGVGNSKTTIVKHLSPNMVCAVRMGGMGVAIGSLIGEEAAEMILNY